ncbi:MAG: hypothetical protein ACXQTG_00415 [Methanoculleaceae archaeon]
MIDPLHPAFLAHSGRFTVLVAPDPVAGETFSRIADPAEGRLLLFICGNFSRILRRLPRRSRDFHIQRAFTAHQLLTALGDAYHTIVWVEHDPSLYAGVDPALVRRIAAAFREAAESQAVILSARRFAGAVRIFAEEADRIIAVQPPDSGGAAGRSQMTLSDFSSGGGICHHRPPPRRDKKRRSLTFMDRCDRPPQ